MVESTPYYPGGSKSRVTRAGAAVRASNPALEDLLVIEEWRAAHRAVLNTFQALLRNRTRGSGIVVAQRHKRRSTIFNKLKRHPKMELARMDDIAGCRLIFDSIADLDKFRSDFHAAKFLHKRRNEAEKYNYITKPKRTGYRGIHDIYEYDVQSINGKKLKGLFIEIQYRTFIHHAWATAVEVIGHVTSSQPKFQQGDRRYEEIMAIASEVLARVFEERTSCLPDMPALGLVSRFQQLDGELSFLSLLAGLNSVDQEISANRNVILIFRQEGELEVLSFRSATEALKTLFELEQENSGLDIVLVRADTSEQVRIAFRNYFSDAGDFVDYLKIGLESLVHTPKTEGSIGI